MKGLAFQVLDSIDAISAIEGTWRDLHRVCTYRSVYNGFDFFLASIKAFPATDIRLHVLLARDGQTPVAIFPFQRSILRRHGARLRVLEYAALWEIDKPYPVIREGYEEMAWRGLAAYLKANRKLWHLFELTEIPDGLAAVSLLPRLFRPMGYMTRLKPDYPTPIVSLTGPWQAREDQHPKMRKKLARMQRVFGERMRFQVYAGVEAGVACLRAYIELESRGWKSGRVGIGKDPDTLRFYEDFFSRLAVRDQLRFGFLSIDSELVSAEIAYVEGDRVFFSHGTYDERFGKYSPGMVSTALFLEHVHGSQAVEGDYLAGFTDGCNLPSAPASSGDPLV